MSKLKAAVSVADQLAQLTGRTLNKLGNKLGMSKDALDGMSMDQIRAAIGTTSQRVWKNKQKDTNRRVGTAGLAGVGGGSLATYGIVDFIHDMSPIPISKVADGTLRKNPKANRAKSQGGRTAAQAKAASKKPVAKKAPKKKAPKKKMAIPKTLPKSKPNRSNVTWQYTDKTGTRTLKKGK